MARRPKRRSIVKRGKPTTAGRGWRKMLAEDGRGLLEWRGGGESGGATNRYEDLTVDEDGAVGRPSPNKQEGER